MDTTTKQPESLRSFAELNAWQKSRVVRKAVAQLVKAWPAEEKFRLTDQIIRSSRGPCSHIAEGYGRFHEKDNARFCRIARGSLYETMDHLSAAYDEGYVDKDMLREHWSHCEEAIRVVNGYIKYLERMGSTSTVAEPAAIYGEDIPIFVEASTGLSFDVLDQPDN